MNKEEIIGTYRKNQKGFGFVKIEDQEDEIYISRENSKNALNGDTVAIKIIAEKEGGKKQEGKIVTVSKGSEKTGRRAVWSFRFRQKKKEPGSTNICLIR